MEKIDLAKAGFSVSVYKYSFKIILTEYFENI